MAGCCDDCARCMGRIPWLTLVAFILFVLGVVVYFGTVLSAFDTVAKFFDIPLDIKAIATPLFIVFLALAAFFVIFAFLTTGETRKEVCHQKCCNVLGRIVQAIIIAVTWVMNVIFVVVSGITIIPLVMFLLMNNECTSKFAKGIQNCVTLKAVGVVPKNDTICGDRAKSFCNDVGDINGNLIAAYIASVVICVSLIMFLMAMSSNYVHMKDELALDEYEDLDKEKKKAEAGSSTPLAPSQP